MNVANYKNENNKYPVSTDTLDFIQEQIKLAYRLAEIYGKNFILASPSGTTDGVIVINGEAMPLKQGTPSSYIVVRETSESITAGGQVFTDARISRYAEYVMTNEGGECYAASLFPNMSSVIQIKETLDEAVKHLVPKGTITMWSGSKAPTGWVLCNGCNYSTDTQGRYWARFVDYNGFIYICVEGGTNHTVDPNGPGWSYCQGNYKCVLLDEKGLEFVNEAILKGDGVRTSYTNCTVKNYSEMTGEYTLTSGVLFFPNLTERFVLGVSKNYAIGDMGGENTHTLTTNELPSHSHNIIYGSSHVSAQKVTTTSQEKNGTSKIRTSADSDDSNGGYIQIDSTGAGQPHNNMPKYYVLAYIIKIV